MDTVEDGTNVTIEVAPALSIRYLFYENIFNIITQNDCIWVVHREIKYKLWTYDAQ